MFNIKHFYYSHRFIIMCNALFPYCISYRFYSHRRINNNKTCSIQNTKHPSTISEFRYEIKRKKKKKQTEKHFSILIHSLGRRSVEKVSQFFVCLLCFIFSGVKSFGKINFLFASCSKHFLFSLSYVVCVACVNCPLQKVFCFLNMVKLTIFSISIGALCSVYLYFHRPFQKRSNTRWFRSFSCLFFSSTNEKFFSSNSSLFMAMGFEIGDFEKNNRKKNHHKYIASYQGGIALNYRIYVWNLRFRVFLFFSSHVTKKKLFAFAFVRKLFGIEKKKYFCWHFYGIHSARSLKFEAILRMMSDAFLFLP